MENILIQIRNDRDVMPAVRYWQSKSVIVTNIERVMIGDFLGLQKGEWSILTGIEVAENETSIIHIPKEFREIERYNQFKPHESSTLDEENCVKCYDLGFSNGCSHAEPSY
jgi:hypothetical protein